MTSSSPEKVLRLGLIGAGRWGRAYIRTIQSMPGAGLARLCSSNPESRGLVDSACRITAEWNDLVEAGDLDGLIVAAPPALHAEMAEAALLAGLPVMVEKPLTLDLIEAERLERIAGEGEVPVLVNHVHLFHPGYAALKKEAAHLGPIRFIRSEGGSWGPFRKDTPPLWDYGPHDLALCLDLMGEEPSSAEAHEDDSRESGEGYGQIVTMKLGFPEGGGAALTVGNLMAGKRRKLAVFFDTCVMVLDDLCAEKLVRHRSPGGDSADPPDYPAGPGEPVPIAGAPPLTRALEAFVFGIRGEAGEAFGVGLGVEIVRILSRFEFH